MAFIVEDGTGLSNANSYVDVAYVNDYFLERLNDGWTGIEATDLYTVDQIKQAYIIRATTYIDSSYKFKGNKMTSLQALKWPRSDVVDSLGTIIAGVPNKVKQAVAELALLAKDGVLYRTPDATANKVKKVTTKLGPITESTEYAGYGDLIEEPMYPYIDALLEELTIENGGATPAPVMTGLTYSSIDAVRSDSDRVKEDFPTGSFDNPPFSDRTLSW